MVKYLHVTWRCYCSDLCQGHSQIWLWLNEYFIHKCCIENTWYSKPLTCTHCHLFWQTHSSWTVSNVSENFSPLIHGVVNKYGRTCSSEGITPSSSPAVGLAKKTYQKSVKHFWTYVSFRLAVKETTWAAVGKCEVFSAQEQQHFVGVCSLVTLQLKHCDGSWWGINDNREAEIVFNLYIFILSKRFCTQEAKIRLVLGFCHQLNKNEHYLKFGSSLTLTKVSKHATKINCWDTNR